MSDLRPDLSPNDDPLERAIADRLRGWSPSTSGLDRDRLLFEAGRASAVGRSRRMLGAWAVAASGLIALGWGWAREYERRQSAERSLAEVRRDWLQSLPRPQPRAIDPPRLLANRGRPPLEPFSYAVLTQRLNDSGELAEPTIADAPSRPNDHDRSEMPILTPNRIRSSPGRFDL